jgi:hypothetical protein
MSLSYKENSICRLCFVDFRRNRPRRTRKGSVKKADNTVTFLGVCVTIDGVLDY